MKNIAITDEDYELGILKGKTIFPFRESGIKQMTMNTKQGVVPYPIKYKGYTKGKLTDQGIAKPKDDFKVNGDIVIEEPILNDFSFSEALKHAKDSQLSSFKWRGRNYTVPARSGIYIKPENRGAFTRSANAAGESVQEHAHHVLNNPNSSELQRKRAQFAINSAKWNHQRGGLVKSDVYPTLDARTKNIIDNGHNYSYDWKTYFVPSSNADYPVGTLKQNGGEIAYSNALDKASNITSPFLRKPMFSTQGLYSTNIEPIKLPLYKQGQSITYMCGGEVKKGIIKEYDATTGKVKLYK